MPSILLTNSYGEGPLDIIRELVPEGFVLKTLPESSSQALFDNIRDADYILAGGRLPIDKDAIRNAVKLKMVQRTGVGLDAIDLQALKEYNIPLYVNKGINADSVAEHTILLILALLKRLITINEELHSAKWNKQGNGIRNYELKGKNVGLVGMGSIGRRVASLLSSFGANIFYHDISRVSEQEESGLGLSYLPFDELLAKVDILSFHCALTEQTRNLLGSRELALLRRGSFVVNTARGGLIDEDALLEALLSGHIAGAALDVHSKEPVGADNPFLSLPNVILTPHIGGISYDSFYSMISEAMNNIKCFENGEEELIREKLFQI